MLPSRGRTGQSILFEPVGSLTAKDLLRLATDPTIPKVGPPAIKKWRDRHHAIARHLASGRTVVETAALTGVTAQRVGDLERTDPAFGQLLDYYREQIRVSSVDDAQEFQGKWRDIGRAALETIQERLEDDELRAKMSVEELRRLASDASDRTVAPPKTAQPVVSTPTHITFNMGSRKLEPKTIDQTGELLIEEKDNGHKN